MCFSPYLGIVALGGRRSPKGLVHNLLVQFFTLDSSKIEVFETYFSDTVITQNDHPSYVKHVLAVFTCFHAIWVLARGGGGGSPKGLVQNLLMQLFTLGSSKIKVLKSFFFDTVIT